MKKKVISILLVLLLLAGMTPFALTEDSGEDAFSDDGAYPENDDFGTDGSYEDPFSSGEEPAAEDGGMTLEELLGIDMSAYPKTMYVRTDNGGTLNVRSEPKTGNNVIGRLEYGAAVTVLGPVVINADWSVISYSRGPDGVGYVMTRFLSPTRPKAKQKNTETAANNTSAGTQTKKKKNDDVAAQNLAEMNKELASAKTYDKPGMAVVRTPRASGWVNFRVGPGAASEKISNLQDGHELKVIGETATWYQVTDPATGKTGYVNKSYVAITPVQPEAEPKKDEQPAKEQMGRLNVNGDFSIQCQLPEGYSMQLINTLGTRIAALITSEDKEQPVFQLSIAYNEIYSDVQRMNDLSQDDLAMLENTFTDQNDVELSYGETAYGTKLLIAREVGADEDFVDILSVYMGYFIEFVMTPNPEARDKTLSDDQIQMCVDFLSELDFVPAVSGYTFGK